MVPIWVNGKRKFRSFSTKEEAELFRAKRDEAAALANPEALSDLSELGKAAVRHGMEKLKVYDATISEAVDYFIRFAKPPKGKISIQEAMDLFREAKIQKNCSTKYIEHSRRCSFFPFRDAFKNCLLNEVSDTEANRYIYGNKMWGVATKNNHNRHLRALYSFAMSRGYATRNPFASVEFVTERVERVAEKVIPAASVKVLLQHALDNGYKAECASMALVFFCGVRVNEVCRIAWDQIRLVGKPIVDIRAGKCCQRRVNPIAENALHWLRACHSSGGVAPENYEKRLQRLRKKAGIYYPQNAARHCFASYHTAFFENPTNTAFMLGHPSPALLYSTYRELVSFEEAEKFWSIVPNAVEQEREAREREEKARQKQELFEREEQQKEEAMAASNCGRAAKGESGCWEPVMDDDVDLGSLIAESLTA
jgi:integrase